MHGVTLLEGKVEKNTLILSETLKLNFELHEKSPNLHYIWKARSVFSL